MLSGTSYAKALAHLQSVFVYGGLYGGYASKQVQVYDVKNTKWSTLPPSPHYYSGAAIIGNQFTLIGGEDTHDTRDTPTNKLQMWTGEEWEVLCPPMHTARSKPGVLAFGDLVIVSGGDGADSKKVDTIEFLDINKRIWIQSNLKLPRPLSEHQMALCGEYIYIYHYYNGYFCRMNKKNFMASLTTNDVHHWEQLENAPEYSSLLQYSTLPVIVGPKGIFIFEKKWTQISEETSYDFTCTASLNETTFFTFGGRELLGDYQTRAVQYDIAVKVSKLI